MDDDPIANLTYVILGLLFSFGPIIGGAVMLGRAGSARRKAQIAYLGRLAQQGHQVPQNQMGMPNAAGTPLSMYPPEVVKTGSGLRIAGWILLGFGILVLFARLGSAGSGM